MSHVLLFGGLNPMEWMIIIGVIVLLFGSSKLPQLAKSLAQSKRAFREGLEEDEREQAARREKQLNAAASAPEPPRRAEEGRRVEAGLTKGREASKENRTASVSERVTRYLTAEAQR